MSVKNSDLNPSPSLYHCSFTKNGDKFFATNINNLKVLPGPERGHVSGVNTSCWKRYEGIYYFYLMDIILKLVGVINQYVLLNHSFLLYYSKVKVNAVFACSGSLN